PFPIGRNTRPELNRAASDQTSIAVFVHAGIGTVRTRFPFPSTSTRHQRPSRCCTSSNVRAEASPRRSPQPTRTASKRPVAFAFERLRIRRREERFGLFDREPVAGAGPLVFGS